LTKPCTTHGICGVLARPSQRRRGHSRDCQLGGRPAFRHALAGDHERSVGGTGADDSHRRPRQVPRLNEVIPLMAQLGGFLGRKSEVEPGVKTIWQGLQRVMDFALGLRFARELQAE